ncbi:hypothetical protein BVRB_8g197650 [Beta vulgaris subsp. vulgaris]|nr:hypothetical protein BVRB_8g197650 [Beta vulgaris subsp. vulgaris]
MKQTGKGMKAHTKVAQAQGNKDRRSCTGISGSPKKGGHGGKFTWAGDGLFVDHEIPAKSVVDVNDPNFEDPADEIVTLN